MKLIHRIIVFATLALTSCTTCPAQEQEPGVQMKAGTAGNLPIIERSGLLADSGVSANDVVIEDGSNFADYPQTIVVSNAGTTEVKGTYTYTTDLSEFSLSPYKDYAWKFGDYYIYYHSFGWRLGRAAGSTELYSVDTLADLPPKTGWLDEEGTPPAPRLYYTLPAEDFREAIGVDNSRVDRLEQVSGPFLTDTNGVLCTIDRTVDWTNNAWSISTGDVYIHPDRRDDYGLYAISTSMLYSEWTNSILWLTAETESYQAGGPTAIWPDYSPARNDATQNGVGYQPTRTTYQGEACWEFDGDDYLDPNMTLTNSLDSASFYFATTNEGYSYFLGQSRAFNGSNDFSVAMDNTERLRAQYGGVFNDLTSSMYNDGNWHYVELDYTVGTFTVDGGDVTDISTGNPVFPRYGLRIGARNNVNETTYDNFFIGYMREIRINGEDVE